MASQEPEYQARRTLEEDSGSDRSSTTGAASRSDQPLDRHDDGLDDGLDEDGLEYHDSGVGRRTRLALLVASVAAVVVVGLAVGYAAIGRGERTLAPSTPSASSASTDPSASTEPGADMLLSNSSMLEPSGAKLLASERTWKAVTTQRGRNAESPRAACLDVDAPVGTPAAQQTILRVLSSSGKAPPGVLHQADVYATPEEATQVFAAAARTLGGCTMSGAYLYSGQTVTGLGDQAVGVVVRVTSGTQQYHSLVLSRTGRVVDVVDATQPGTPVPVAGVAQTVARVISMQCHAAGGRCAARPVVRAGPPPLGGDRPGFLTSGDLPPLGRPPSAWVGNVPAVPDPDFPGSGCETVSWAKATARSRSHRVYLLQDQAATFGLDEVVLSAPNPGAARKLVAQVKSDLDSCAVRKLTATVTVPARVTGTGAGSAPITGWTAAVAQKTTDGMANYRVGIVSTGSKVVYALLNPQRRLDLDGAAWDGVTVRAAERASQVR